MEKTISTIVQKIMVMEDVGTVTTMTSTVHTDMAAITVTITKEMSVMNTAVVNMVIRSTGTMMVS